MKTQTTKAQAKTQTPKRETQWALWARISVMFISLSTVLFTIYKLNSGDIQPGAFLLPGTHSQSLNWCETRVKSIEYSQADGGIAFRLTQRGLAWWLEIPSERQVATSPVEFWFTEFCVVKLDSMMSKVPENPAAGQIAVNFVDGSQSFLEVWDPAVYKLKDEYFSSAQLAEGLKRLKSLQ